MLAALETLEGKLRKAYDEAKDTQDDRNKNLAVIQASAQWDPLYAALRVGLDTESRCCKRCGTQQVDAS